MSINNTIFTDERLLDEIRHFGKIKSVGRDTIIMSPGDDVLFVPIVQKGVLRIIRQNDDGKEIFLYHLYPGQTCQWP